MENLTGGTPPVRYLPCVVPCKLYFENEVIIITLKSIASMTLIDSCVLNKKRVNIIIFYPYPIPLNKFP